MGCISTLVLCGVIYTCMNLGRNGFSGLENHYLFGHLYRVISIINTFWKKKRYILPGNKSGSIHQNNRILTLCHVDQELLFLLIVFELRQWCICDEALASHNFKLIITMLFATKTLQFSVNFEIKLSRTAIFGDMALFSNGNVWKKNGILFYLI